MRQFASGVTACSGFASLLIKFAENITLSGTSHSWLDPNGTVIILTPFGA
jgi:hypothetical protein